MTESVSIVTAAFNSENTIAQTIESVLSQTMPCKEYIIVDGGSTDDTLEIAESYREKFAKKEISYQIISEKDRGIYDAMNKGIRLATGTLIGLINSDDWYEPEAIETVLGRYRQEPFDMMYADLRMWKDGKPIQIKKARQRAHYVTTRDWNHPTTFITKEIYEKYSYACESVYDDLDLWLRLIRDGKKIVTVNRILANYRLGGKSNQKSIGQAVNRARVKYRIYRKNGFSRLYLLEAVGMELGKLILA